MSQDTLKHTSVVLQKNKLEAIFELPIEPMTRFSQKFVIIGAVTVQIQTSVHGQTNPNMHHYNNSGNSGHNVTVKLDISCNMSFEKLVLNVSSSRFTVQNRRIKVTEHKGVHLLHEIAPYHGNRNTPISFDVTLSVDLEDTAGMFTSLYDDTDLVDFELRGEGGTVSIHKTILAAASPVFKQMLSKDWKETVTGKLTIAETTKVALEHFKAYLYLGKIPDSDLDQLLVIAACYMMPALEIQCIMKVLSLLTAENVLDWCKFAVTAEMTRLHLAILEHIQIGAIDVGDIPTKTTTNENKEDADNCNNIFVFSSN